MACNPGYGLNVGYGLDGYGDPCPATSFVIPFPVTNPTVDYWWSHPAFLGQDEMIAANENLINEGSHNSINIPWLVGLMSSQGNAMTTAIAHNAVVLSEPEWGNDSSGMGSAGGSSGMLSSSGGLVVSW